MLCHQTLAPTFLETTGCILSCVRTMLTARNAARLAICGAGMLCVCAGGLRVPCRYRRVAFRACCRQPAGAVTESLGTLQPCAFH